MKAIPRITFGLIVLNGEPFLQYNLEALYPFAHQIVVVEGASPRASAQATADGHSIDHTLEIVRDFIDKRDPEGKVLLVTAEDEGYGNGFWPGDKDEQSAAYGKRATGDWLWQVDVDEFYLPEDMAQICDLLPRHKDVTCFTVGAVHFWGGFDYQVKGGLFISEDFQGEYWGFYRRIFKWGAGYSYISHRPPTVIDADGNSSNRKKLNISRVFPHIRMRHYFMIFLPQVFRKGNYYDKMGWKHEDEVEARYRRLFTRLQPRDYFKIFSHRGTHNWLVRFQGVHPPVILALIDEISKGDLKQSLRPVEDIEELLRDKTYIRLQPVYEVYELVRAFFEQTWSFLNKNLRKYAKKVLRR